MELEKFIKTLNKDHKICFDVETTGLNFYEHKIFGFSLVQLRPELKTLWYRVNPGDISWVLPLKMFMADGSFKKVMFNSKFDRKMIHYNHGIINVTNCEDPMIKIHLLDENLGRYKLKILCDRFFKNDKYMQKLVKLSEKIDAELKRLKTKDFSQVNDKLMGEYGVGDGILTLKLDEYISDRWIPELDKPYQLELDLINVLVDIEIQGVDIDVKYLKKLNVDFLTKRDKILQFILDCGLLKGINNQEDLSAILNSKSKKFSKLIYEDLKLKPISYTEAGNYCADKHALNKIMESEDEAKDEVMILSKVIEYTTVEYELNTYIEPYLEQGILYGKVYPSYWQLLVNGRLSCGGPNMQNLPKREESHGDLIRHIIYNPLHDQGYEIYDPDYSQIELRLIAHYTQCELMTIAFLNGVDLHKQTSLELGISRADGKELNFSIPFGMGARGFTKKMGWPIEKSRSYLRKYYTKYHEIKSMMKDVEAVIKNRGYVKTFGGRRRHLKINKAYVGLNSIIQGTAAEIIKKAMINIHREMKHELNLKAAIHDELLLIGEKDKHDKRLIELMEDTKTFRVPITVDMTKFGSNWGVK